MAMSHVLVAYVPQGHMSQEKAMSCVTILLTPKCHMSVLPMTHVEFKKCPCHPVDFKGQGSSRYGHLYILFAGFPHAMLRCL